MTKIWNETDVTTATIASHLTDSGLNVTAIDANRVWLRSASGLAYSVAVLEDRKFIRIGSWLPLNKAQFRDAKVEFAHRLSQNVFLGCFCLDDEENLAVSYVLSYQQGLIPGQATAIINRFASMLQFIIDTYNEDHMIDFGSQSVDDGDVTDGSGSPLVLPDSDTLH